MPSYLHVNGAGDSFGASVSSTTYESVAGGATIAQATIADSQNLVRNNSYTWQLFQARVPTNTSTSTCTLSSFKNSAAGNQTLSWTSTQTGQKQDTTHTDSVVNGDLIQYRLVIATGCSQAITLGPYASVLQQASANAPLLLCDASVGTALNSGIPYIALGWSQNYYAAESVKQVKVKESTTFSNYRTVVKTNTTTVSSTLAVRKNSATGNQTLTWAAGVTGVQEDTTHTDTFASGDFINFALTAGGTGGSMILTTYALVSSGTALIVGGGGNNSVPVAGTTNYFPINGKGPATAATTEANVQVLATLAAHWGNFQVNVLANSLTASLTADVRVNASSSGTPALSLTAGQTGFFEDSTTDLSLAGTEQVCYRAVAAAGSGSITWMLSVQSPYSHPGTVSVVPATLALILTRFAPSVVGVAPKTAVPAVRALVLTPFAPVVKTPRAVVPATRALSLATFVPSVALSAKVRVTPATAALVTARFAPTVAAPRVVIPATRALVLAGFAPSIAIAATGVTVTPGTAALVTARFAPLIVVPRGVVPGTRALVLATFVATIRVPRAVTPSTRALVLTTFAPNVAAAAANAVTPGTRALVLAGFAPVVVATAARIVVPATRALILARFAPLIATPRNVVPATRALVLATFVPTVKAPRAVTPGTRALVLTTFVPNVATAAGRTVVPGTRALVLLSFAPRVAAPRTVVPATRALVLLTFAPAATAGHKLTPPTLALLLLTFAPLIAHVTSHPDNIIELRGGLSLVLLAGLVSIPQLIAGAYDVELAGSSEPLLLAGNTGVIMLAGG